MLLIKTMIKARDAGPLFQQDNGVLQSSGDSQSLVLVNLSDSCYGAASCYASVY
jgi:hypothetical protein